MTGDHFKPNYTSYCSSSCFFMCEIKNTKRKGNNVWLDIAKYAEVTSEIAMTEQNREVQGKKKCRQL